MDDYGLKNVEFPSGAQIMALIKQQTEHEYAKKEAERIFKQMKYEQMLAKDPQRADVIHCLKRLLKEAENPDNEWELLEYDIGRYLNWNERTDSLRLKFKTCDLKSYDDFYQHYGFHSSPPMSKSLKEPLINCTVHGADKLELIQHFAKQIGAKVTLYRGEVILSREMK